MSVQHNSHVIAWARVMASHVTERRYWNVWYRGKVSRMTQLNHLRRRGDLPTYLWMKEFWRRELMTRRAG